jgi:hypothetical protein
MAVEVETVLLCVRDGVLHYRTAREPMPACAHPDDVARQLSGLTACTLGGLLHSTSWRVDGTAVVLTYVALPDPRPDAEAVAVPLDGMVVGAGPLLPSPVTVDVGAVAAHACRHLALLAATDPDAALSAHLLPRLWEPITKLTPAGAGGYRLSTR